MEITELKNCLSRSPTHL